MPSSLRVEAELDLWEEYWLTHKEICPSSIAATLKSVPPSGFSNIRMALKILATLPITSCECERSFSGMKRVKTYLSSKMGQERQNGLCLLNFHLDKVPDPKVVCERYLAIKDQAIDCGKNFVFY